MCGRIALSFDNKSLCCACSYKPNGSNTYKTPQWIEEHNDGKTYKPSYNIAPGDVTPVLVSASQFKSGVDEHDRLLKPMMWGFIPPWHMGDYKNHKMTTNNCRLDNIKKSKLFGPSLKNGGRCVIVAEGFYEWQTNSMGKIKQPYFIYTPQNDTVQIDETESWKNEYCSESGWQGIKLMYLAGVYSMWKRNSTIVYSYSVITMDSNNTFDWLHHRMPAILTSNEQMEAWLNVSKVNCDMALSYLKSANTLSWHPVSTRVNNSRNKSSKCNKRISLEKNKSPQNILTYFTKNENKKRKINEN